MKFKRILIVEDEETIADILEDNLIAEGYKVLVARDGKDGLEQWQRNDLDLVVLDVMLPLVNGYDVCKTMRDKHDQTPVLFLSALGQPTDRVKGLSLGADDYLAKPFHLPEFLLRVEKLVKRQSWRQEQEIDSFSFADFVVDFKSWTIQTKDAKKISLGEREMGILRILIKRKNEVVSRDEILDYVWGDDAFPSSRTVDNFVLKLRKIFEPNRSEPIYIHNIWGVGYKFTPDGQS
ncbi:MAG TPA: response regulator transcription factor [Trueperaceae bacterium]|nr:response regulator transcription factor [Trueperaceae bacterium]